MKPPFIVIDGADNVGKATQARLLRERLEREGMRVGSLDFPRYESNTFGALIREALDGKRGDFMAVDPKIASVLYAADRFESKDALAALLERSDVVILDRYVSANMLHQGAKIAKEEERHEFIAWLEHVEYDIFGMPRPDLTIALYAKEEQLAALRRSMDASGLAADAAERDRVHQVRVAECLRFLASFRESWVTVDCSGTDALRSREDIHEELYGIIKPLITPML
jgi:dTMP kinase